MKEAKENSKIQECLDLAKQNNALQSQLKEEQAFSSKLRQKLQSAKEDVEKELTDKFKAVTKILK